MSENLRFEFQGELYQGPRGGYYIDFPFDAEKAFDTRRQVKVKIWFDGYLSRKSLLLKGDGSYWLSVSKEVRTAIGKGDGELVNVVLEPDTDPRTVPLPEDLEWLLDNEPEMKERFHSFSYSAQQFFVEYLVGTADPDTRVSRINKLFEYLRKFRGKKLDESVFSGS